MRGYNVIYTGEHPVQTVKKYFSEKEDAVVPAYATHHIFASIVQRVTGDTMVHIISLYPAGYRWGALGPDPLYYYHAPFSNQMSRLARRMHEEPSAPLFEALCEAAVQQHNTAALAYVFGFCTHYALERVSHSFISAQADRLSVFMPGWTAETRRRMVESDIDGIMISEYISPDSENYEAYKLLDPGAAECTVFSKVFSEAAKNVYNVRISPASVYRSLGDMRKAMRLAHNGVRVKGRLERFERFMGRSGAASSMLRPEKPLPAGCANTEHLQWQSGGELRTESFFDLFDAAVPLAVTLQRAVLERYYQQKPLDKRFFPTNFYGETIKK